MSSVITRPFTPDPELVQLSVAYKNDALIADKVLPRKPVGKEDFKYIKYPIGMFLTLPETKVGRKGKVNKVNFEGETLTDSVLPYGLSSDVPKSDIENAPEGYSPLSLATEGLRDLILLDREVRVANKVFNAAEYAAANKIQLSGGDQWDEYETSDPLGDLKAGLAVPINRPNKLLLGFLVWDFLRSHPQIVKAVNKNSGDTGMVSRQELAELLELDEVIVGEGWINIAKPGQPVQKARVWGNHALAFRDNPVATPTFGMTFGYTVQHGGPVAGTKMVDAGEMGLEGGTTVINGEKVKELIAANDLAFFWEDCVPEA